MSIYTEIPGDQKFCAGCTFCCRWPGDVLFTPVALAGIADHLKMDERECVDTYFNLSSDRHYLITQPTEDGGCIFLSDSGCMVYPHRPRQCRTFPYTWQRPEKDLMNLCKLFCAISERQLPL